MDNLHEFLRFNNICPICQNPLTLYLQWTNSVCFQAKKIKSNQYHFEQFKCKNETFGDNDYITLFDHDKSSETRFNSSKVANEAKRYQMYFFYLCNAEGFKDIHGTDYEINIHRGCYFRSTPFYEYKKQERAKHWKLEISDKDNTKLINADEAFSFKKETREAERIYMLQLNYTDSKTVLMHYSITPEQRKEKGFEPNIFDKTVPLLGTRPNFDLDSRDKLIDRFDNWILVS